MLFKTLLCAISFTVGFCANHSIILTEDQREHFPLSTFGFLSGGRLFVHIKNFTFFSDPRKYKFGFSLQRTINDGVSSYMENLNKKCLLEEERLPANMSIVLFNIDFQSGVMNVSKYGDKPFRKLKVINNINDSDVSWTLTDFMLSHTEIISLKSRNKCYNSTNDVIAFKRINPSNETWSFSGKFTIGVNCSKQAGLYNLYFHNCGNLPVNIELNMIEHNVGTFLSAGQIPLPAMYATMSFCFFLAAIVWTIYVREHSVWRFKIHWLMTLVVYIKAIAVAFHAINYYKTGILGFHLQTWAVLYYIVHVLKGALLFTTIVLIGTGYFFVKHVLSSKEKKLFLVVIPLQVTANVAQIINDSTEEGNPLYQNWYRLTLLVDLACCGAIFLPVVWSIRHLTEAAKTDGKAAISLKKLKLFRYFYVMIVCYFYFTRIIVYLVKIFVPFQYTWLDEFFTEAATLIFFILTGYKFRPANNNPYLHVPQDDPDDIVMENVSVHSAFGERLTRVKRIEHSNT